ncbi:MAG: hypothetical protein Tsb0015_14280 [Simkaniaceae bacterium]
MEIIGIAAGKGGVGKSSVTVNLALAMKEIGFKAGIIDADVYGPSVHKMLGTERLPAEKEGKIIPAQGFGISYISLAFFREEGEANALRAPIANDIILQFLDSVHWEGLDYLFIDFPPGTGDIPLTLVQKKPMSVILVTMPGELSLIDVQKALHMLQQMKVPIYGILENMSYLQSYESEKKQYIFGKGSGEALANQAHVSFLGQIPIEPLVAKTIEKSQSMFQEFPDAIYVKKFLDLAKQIISFQQKKEYLTEFELIWKEDL